MTRINMSPLELDIITWISPRIPTSVKTILRPALRIYQKATGVKFIDGWFNDDEGSFMARCIRSTKSLDGVIVEIGSFLGRSSILIAQRAKKHGDRMYCIDTWDNSIYGTLPEAQRVLYGGDNPVPKNASTQFQENIRQAKVDGVITAIRGRAEDVVRNWDKPIKLLFIDGCHEYEYVIKDCLLWQKYVVRNGLILFHDYIPTWPGLMRAVDECIDQKRFNTIGQYGSLKGFMKIGG